MVQCNRNCWRYVRLQASFQCCGSGISDPEPITNPTYFPNKLYNFVNLYFKVVKFVFGYKYSTLENLYIAFQSPAVVLWYTLTFFQLHLLTWSGLRVGSGSGSRSGSGMIWSMIRIPTRTKSFRIHNTASFCSPKIYLNYQNMQLSVKDIITRSPHFYVARNHMVRYWTTYIRGEKTRGCLMIK